MDAKRFKQEWLAFAGGSPHAAAALARVNLEEPLSDVEVAALLAELDESARRRYADLMSPARRHEWVAARRCELLVRRELAGLGAAPASLRLSIAHAGGWVACIGRQGLGAVGVDLEPEGREVVDGLRERILGREDCTQELSALEAWVVKEACFKANPRNEGLVSWQHRLKSWNAERLEGEFLEAKTGARGRVRLLRMSGMLVAFAAEGAAQGGN